MGAARRTLKPEDVTVIIDTREQQPWELTPLLSERGTLTTGDYSVKGLEKEISIERKSLPDLLGCIGQGRERFDAEIKRLLGYPCRAIIVEADWADIEAGAWRNKLTVSTVMGSILGWIAYGIPIMFAGNAEKASQMASRMLFIAARRRWHELQSFQDGLKVV